MAVTVTTPPTSEPVTMSEQKAHSRIIDNAEDDLVQSLISAARQWVETETERAIPTQTLTLTLDAFPSYDTSDRTRPMGTYDSGTADAPILLERPPVQSVTSVTYLDEAGTTRTLSPSLYRVDLLSHIPRIVPAYGQTWPSTRRTINAVSVTYVAGYTTVPAGLKALIKLVAGHWYDNGRDATAVGTIVTAMPMTIQALVDQYSVNV